MKSLPHKIFSAPPFQAFLSDLAALGITPVSEGGCVYTVIQARSNQRWWLLPAEDRRAAAAGLEMMHPITRAASAAKTITRVLAKLGLSRLIAKGHIRFSGVPDATKLFGADVADLSYFTGTDGPHRKTAIQVMEAGGTILGYCKLSREEHIRPYIRNEAKMLAYVADLDLKALDLPHVLAIHDDLALTLLVTDSKKTSDSTSPLQLGDLHIRCLRELCVRTKRDGAASLLAELQDCIAMFEKLASDDWGKRISRALDALHHFEADMQLCFVHGDFTPWNCFVRGDHIYVFDWEYANPAWPVGFDFIHFMLSATPLNKQLQRLPLLLDELASVHFDGDKEAAHRALLLSLACHACFYLRRLAEVNGCISDWSHATVRASLIDALLDACNGKNI